MGESSDLTFIGFSARSTGELSWTMNLIGAGAGRDMAVYLKVNKQLDYFIDRTRVRCGVEFIEDVSTLNIDGKIDLIECLCRHAGTIVFIDLNAFFLEQNITENDKIKFYEFVARLAEQGRTIAVMDFLNCFIEHSRYVEKVALVRNKIANLVSSVPKSFTKLFFYYQNLEKRSVSMLSPLVSGVKALRQVPVLAPNRHEARVIYYAAHSPSVRRKGEHKIIIAYSKILTFTLSKENITSLLAYLINGFTACFKNMDEIVLIDPEECAGAIRENCTTQITSFPWLSQSALYDYMADAKFLCVFSPYSSISTIAIENKIPVVSVTSSRSSTESETVRKVFKNTPIAPFTALGIREDIAYIDLMKEDNPFFTAVYNFDAADPSAFEILRDAFAGGQIEKAISDFHERKQSFNLVSSARLMEDLAHH